MYAAALAKEMSSSLHLIYVDDRKNENAEVDSSKYEKLIALSKTISTQFPEVPLTFSVFGSKAVVDSIIKKSKQLNAEFIVIGTTSTTIIERLLMGSVASKLIATSDIPVLCIPANVVFDSIHHFVYATDLEDDNIEASKRMVPILQSLNAEIRYVHIDTVDQISGSALVKDMVHAIRERIDYHKIAGFVIKSSEFQSGIDKFLAKHRADVVIMYTKSDLSETGIFSKSNTINFALRSKLPILSLR